jgi:hypothetical protein
VKCYDWLKALSTGKRRLDNYIGKEERQESALVVGDDIFEERVYDKTMGEKLGEIVALIRESTTHVVFLRFFQNDFGSSDWIKIHQILLSKAFMSGRVTSEKDVLGNHEDVLRLFREMHEANIEIGIPYWKITDYYAVISDFHQHQIQLGAKLMQIEEFLESEVKTGEGDVLRVCLWADVALLRLRTMWRYLNGNSEFFQKLDKVDYMSVAMENLVEEDIGAIPTTTDFMIRRYNINIYYARQYWMLWKKTPDFEKENAYPASKIKTFILAKNALLTNPIFVNDLHAIHAPYGRRLENLHQQRLLTLEAEAYKTSHTFAEQLEFSAMSAITLGCNECTAVTPVEGGDTIHTSMFMGQHI